MKKTRSSIQSAKPHHKYPPNASNPSPYNAIYSFQGKKPTSPSSRAPQSHPSTKRTTTPNKHLPKISSADPSSRKQFSSFNDDLSILHSLWDDLGVTSSFRSVFESYIHTISAQGRRVIIENEKASILKIRDVYATLSNSIDSRKESIQHIKESLLKMDAAYFEDKDDIDESVVSAMQENVNKYRIHTVNVINMYTRLREMTAYYVTKGKFDFSQSAYHYIGNKYLLQLKYDIDFIYKHDALNKYFHIKSKEPNDALLSNLPVNGEHSSSYKKHYIHLNNDLMKQINECKYAIASELMYNQVDDEKKSTLTSATFRKVNNQDTNPKTLSRSSSAFYYSQFKSKSRPWSNSSRGNITHNMQSRLEEMYKLYAIPNQNMYLRQYGKNNKLSITLHKLKGNNKSYNSMFMTRHFKMRKNGFEKDERILHSGRNNEDNMKKEDMKNKEYYYDDKEEKAEEDVGEEASVKKRNENIARGIEVVKPEVEEEEEKRDNTEEHKEDYNVDEEIMEDNVIQEDKNINNENDSDNKLNKVNDNKNKENEKINNNGVSGSSNVVPLSIKYSSFYEEDFTTYMNSVSTIQKQIFNIAQLSPSLQGAYPQVLLISPSSSEQNLPPGICIYHKEYIPNQKYPDIMIDHITSLDDSSLIKCISDFISYIKQSISYFVSLKVKLNSTDDSNIKKLNNDIVQLLENDLEFSQSIVEMSEDNPAQSTQILIYIKQIAEDDNNNEHINHNVLSLKSLITYCDNNNDSNVNEDDDIVNMSDKYMNSLLSKTLKSLINNEYNEEESPYKDIVIINKKENDDDIENMNSLCKSIANENDSSNITAYASAEIFPIINNIISFTYDDYYYNKITPLSHIKTVIHQQTNTIMHFISFPNAKYSLMICEMSNSLKQNIFDSISMNIYEYFSNTIFEKLTDDKNQYTSLYVPSFNIKTHLSNDVVDEFIKVDFITEKNNVIIELPVNDECALVIKDSFVLGVVTEVEGKVFPIQLLVVSKDSWKSV